MKEGIIGLDVGTNVAKAVLFDLSGNELHVAGQSYQLHTPRPGWVELEPNDIWQAVLRVLKAITDRAAPGLRVRAIALATQGGTLIPCRADGTPTCRAITWMDQRASRLAAQWQAEGVAERVRQISGWSPEAGLPLLSIAWLRQARPEVFETTDLFLSVNDFVAQRLTGRLGTNPSMAGEMLLTDLTTGEWSKELCSLVGIVPQQMSPILPSVVSLGNVLPQVGRLTGLAPQTAVINGGQDHSCEALALGLTSRGGRLLACGTAWVVNGIVDEPAIESIPPSASLNNHVVPGRWVVSQFLGGLGACLEWWVQQRSGRQGDQTREESWASTNAALGETVPGCSGVVYLPQTGLRRGSGTISHGGFFGLRLDHSWADMGRAVMEAAAYELRWTLEHLRGADPAVEHMWMVGGAAHSPVWPQIVADVTRVPISLTQYTHGPALGAAILAGVGLGVFDSVQEGQANFEVSARRIEPADAHAAAYDRQYAAYRQLSQALVQ